MRIVIVGSGYVGLVTGACLAESGHAVTCIDSDQHRVAGLRLGMVPFSEPGLDALVLRNVRQRRLSFVECPRAALHDAAIAFIAVGTPALEGGGADTRQVIAAASEIARHAPAGCIIVNKSTSPVGTLEAIRRIADSEAADRGLVQSFPLVANPEFLREGTAVDDFLYPDRIVLGLEDSTAESVMRALFAPFIRDAQRLLVMRPRDAEIAKLAANAMLATRISFMNEIAHLCGAVGADVEQIRRAVGSDTRIGSRHLQAGCGFGGSCLPKDLSALAEMLRRAGLEANILEAVQRVNVLQKRWAFDLLLQRFGHSLRGCRIAVWGLAFKPQTDDLREAPSHALIADILEAGGQVTAHDPLAMQRARNEWPPAWFAPDRLRLVADPVAAAEGADAVVLATEWPVYRSIDFAILRQSLRGLLVIDGRNQFDPLQMARLGYEYCGVGRGLHRPSCIDSNELQRVALITAA